MTVVPRCDRGWDSRAARRRRARTRAGRRAARASAAGRRRRGHRSRAPRRRSPRARASSLDRARRAARRCSRLAGHEARERREHEPRQHPISVVAGGCGLQCGQRGDLLSCEGHTLISARGTATVSRMPETVLELDSPPRWDLTSLFPDVQTALEELKVALADSERVPRPLPRSRRGARGGRARVRARRALGPRQPPLAARELLRASRSRRTSPVRPSVTPTPRSSRGSSRRRTRCASSSSSG